MSVKTWVAVAVFACALVSFYRGTLAWFELKRRARCPAKMPALAIDVQLAGISPE